MSRFAYLLTFLCAVCIARAADLHVGVASFPAVADVLKLPQDELAALPDGAIVHCVGRDKPADAGGGDFEVVPGDPKSTDNGGTLRTLPDGRSLRMIGWDGDPRTFGLVPNDRAHAQANDAALAAAISYACESTPGGETAGPILHLPTGETFITRPVDVFSGITIEGQGRRTSRIVKIGHATGTGTAKRRDAPSSTDYAVDSIINIVHEPGKVARRISLRDFELCGNTDGGQLTDYGIYGGDTTASTFQRIEFMFVGTMLDFDLAYLCSFSDIPGNARSACNIRGGTSLTFTDVYCNASTHGSADDGWGFYFCNVSYSALIGCAMDGKRGASYAFEDCPSFTVISCGDEKSIATARGTIHVLSSDITFIGLTEFDGTYAKDAGPMPTRVFIDRNGQRRDGKRAEGFDTSVRFVNCDFTLMKEGIADPGLVGKSFDYYDVDDALVSSEGGRHVIFDTYRMNQTHQTEGKSFGRQAKAVIRWEATAGPDLGTWMLGPTDVRSLRVGGGQAVRNLHQGAFEPAVAFGDNAASDYVSRSGSYQRVGGWAILKLSLVIRDIPKGRNDALLEIQGLPLAPNASGDVLIGHVSGLRLPFRARGLQARVEGGVVHFYSLQGGGKRHLLTRANVDAARGLDIELTAFVQEQ